jgi:hypothetical protein
MNTITTTNTNTTNTAMKETSKNCVSDYPLGRSILRNRNERRAVADVRFRLHKSKQLETIKDGIVVVDISERVLDKRLKLAEMRARRRSKLLRGFKFPRKMENKKVTQANGVTNVNANTSQSKSQVSFGSVECREYARTVGDNEVVGPVPLCLDWEVLGVMVASVDQYEDFRALNRKEDFLLAPEERVSALEKCGVVTSTIMQLERERLVRLEAEWTSSHLEEMARTFPTKSQGPQGVRQSLKRSGRTWSAIRRRMSLKSAQRNLKSLMKKLRVTLKHTGSKAATYGPRLPVQVDQVHVHVPKAKAGLEALVHAQSDLPACGNLNLMIKWEKVMVEGRPCVCCTCMLECFVVSRVVLRV